MATHVLVAAGDSLTKRYVSWQRGEHLREWAALRQVHRHAPGLAPRPISADLAARPPTITMSRLPGEPLTDPPSTAQVTGVVAAVRTLWLVPPADAPIGRWSNDLAFGRRLTAGPRPDAGVAAAAWAAARRWWQGPDPSVLAVRPATLVLGHRSRPDGRAPLLARLRPGLPVRTLRRRRAPPTRVPPRMGHVLAVAPDPRRTRRPP